MLLLIRACRTLPQLRSFIPINRLSCFAFQCRARSKMSSAMPTFQCRAKKKPFDLSAVLQKSSAKCIRLFLWSIWATCGRAFSTRMKRRFSPQRKQFLPNLHLNSTESVLTLPATAASFPMKQISADCLQLQTSCAKGILFPFPSSRAVIPQCSQCWRKIVSPKALPNFVSAKVSSSATIPKAVSPSNG